MVRGNGRDVSGSYVLTVMCDAVDGTAGRCAECIPHVLTSLAYFFLNVCLWGFH